ncbi:MAG: hypothetical protein QW303_03340 [Nitrososphaerota archaeon]
MLGTENTKNTYFGLPSFFSSLKFKIVGDHTWVIELGSGEYVMRGSTFEEAVDNFCSGLCEVLKMNKNNIVVSESRNVKERQISERLSAGRENLSVLPFDDGSFVYSVIEDKRGFWVSAFNRPVGDPEGCSWYGPARGSLEEAVSAHNEIVGYGRV